MTSSFKINSKTIGNASKAYLIAEIAQAHDGSLGFAHAFIDAAFDAGADAVKFQTHIALAESTKNEKFRIKFSYEDQNRFDYWKRMEFTLPQWIELAKHAKEKKITFLSSPFSVEAFDLLQKIEMPAWKIASGELGNEPLIDLILETKKPVLISTGMSSWSEVDGIVDLMLKNNTDYCLMQCTSKYPTPLSQIGLNIIDQYRTEYDCNVGLSDHSGSIFPPIAAINRGVDLVEIHLTLDKRMFGPDVASSLTVDEFSLVSKARDSYFEMISNPVNKDTLSVELNSNKMLFGRSLALEKSQLKGTIITKEHLRLKKPGGGLSFTQMYNILGSRLARDVNSDELLTLDDFEI